MGGFEIYLCVGGVGEMIAINDSRTVVVSVLCLAIVSQVGCACVQTAIHYNDFQKSLGSTLVLSITRSSQSHAELIDAGAA